MGRHKVESVSVTIVSCSRSDEGLVSAGSTAGVPCREFGSDMHGVRGRDTDAQVWKRQRRIDTGAVRPNTRHLRSSIRDAHVRACIELDYPFRLAVQTVTT